MYAGVERRTRDQMWHRKSPLARSVIMRVASYMVPILLALLCIHMFPQALAAEPTSSKPQKKSDSTGKSSAKSQKGWHIYQESQIYGDHEIFVSTLGVKVVNKKLGTSVVLQLPSRKFTMYNQRMKIMYQTELRLWKGGIARRMKIIFPDQLDFNWKNTGSQTIAGLNSTIFSCTNIASKRRRSKLGLLKEPKVYKYYVADDIKVPEDAANMVAQYYDFPRMGKIPLKVTHGSGSHKLRLDTLKSEEIAIPASAYAVPPNLKAVKDDGQLLFEGSGTDTGLLDLIGGE